MFYQFLNVAAKGEIEKEGLKFKHGIYKNWSEGVLQSEKFREIPDQGVKETKLLGLINKWTKLEKKNWDGTNGYVSGNCSKTMQKKKKSLVLFSSRKQVLLRTPPLHRTPTIILTDCC